MAALANEEDKIATLERQIAELTATQKELMGQIRRGALPRPEISFITNWVKDHGVMITHHVRADPIGHELFPYRQKLYDWADRIPGLNEFRVDDRPEKKVWYFEDEQLEAYLNQHKRRTRGGLHEELEDSGANVPPISLPTPKTPEQLQLEKETRTLIEWVRKKGDTDLREYGTAVMGLSQEDPHLIQLRDFAHEWVCTHDKAAEHISNKKDQWTFRRLKE